MSEHARLDLLLDGLLHPGEVDRLVAGARTTSAEEMRWLSVRVVAHLDQIEATAHDRAQVDVDTARQVAASLITLIDDGAAALDADGRALVHGAVEYFVLDRDSSSDTDDGLGFDDDARVLNAVLTAVGRADLRVQPA